MKNLLQNSLLFILASLLSLLVGEGIVRFYTHHSLIYDIEMTRYALHLKTPHANPSIGFVHRQNSDGVFMGVELKTNSTGQRAPHDYPLAPGPRVRVAHLGDSLTLGWGVKEEESFVSLLNQGETEMLNFGHGNFNAEQISAYYADHVVEFKPRLVIYNYFINDAEVTPPNGVKGANLLSHSMLLSFVWSRMRMLFPSTLGVNNDFVSYYKDLYDGPGWSKTEQALIRLKAAVEDNGGKLIVVLLPELHDPRQYPFLSEHKKIGEFLTSQNIRFVDLLPVFSQVEDPRTLWVARDDAHPNALAHKMIAEAEAKIIADALK